jgi:iron(III) transport system permease protein
MKTSHKLLFVISTLVVAVIVLVQAEAILALFQPQSEVWLHIREFLLAGYIRNTVQVVLTTMGFAAIIGTLLAFGVSCYEFPGRKLISRLLYLPLAIPPFVGAYVYASMFQPNGMLANFFEIFGVTTRVHSFWTAVLVFTSFLFPYVYITVKAFISRGMSSYIENARVLGKREGTIFLRVILPISKTAIITGAIFTGLEVLGDFGAVSYLNLHTLSTAIFTSWFSFQDLDSALRLSGMIVLPVFFMLIIRGIILRFKFQTATTSKASTLSRKRLSPLGMIMFYSFAGFVVLMSLGLPLYRLITWALMSFQNIRWDQMLPVISDSLLYSLLATGIILVLAIVMTTYTRTGNKILSELYGRITLVSYALPGPVIAIMVLFFSLNLSDWLSQWLQISLAASVFMLLLGYVLRYLGIAYENLENGYKKIGFRHHEVARTLGSGFYKTLFRVDLPMLRPFLVSASALVFIDLIRELPLTLALRPFNFHTLATQTHQFAANEMLPESAIPSLIIVVLSMIMTSVLFINNKDS